MSTGKHLKIKSMGDNALGVTLEGDPRKPEPIHFRVCFPGGDVDIVRCEDGSNWVHLRVNRPGVEFDCDAVMARVVDARIDAVGVAPTERVEVIGDSRVYHVAFRVEVAK